MICPEVAVNDQVLHENKTFYEIVWKNWNFSKFCLEKLKLFVKLPEKGKIFQKFAWKNRIFFTRIHDPQISNQIDAADIDCSVGLVCSHSMVLLIF